MKGHALKKRQEFNIEIPDKEADAIQSGMVPASFEVTEQQAR